MEIKKCHKCEVEVGTKLRSGRSLRFWQLVPSGNLVCERCKTRRHYNKKPKDKVQRMIDAINQYFAKNIK